MQHGLIEPEECCLCGCPQFVILRQWKTRGFINAVWKCTLCNARNLSQTPNTYIADKLKAEADDGDRRRSRSPKKERNRWGDD